MRLNKYYFFFISLLVLVLLFSGVSIYGQQIYKWKVPTGSATGTYYPALSGIAMVLGLYTDDIYATASVGGGGASNARKVGTGEAAFSLTTSNIAYYATRGEALEHGVHCINYMSIF